MSGDLVMGRFRLREPIGSGGMGVVYRAFDERLRREVAVKEVSAGDPERVLREAQAAARLNHRGIVTVYELGRRGSNALLVSELVGGATLAELSAEGALSDRDVAELGDELCDALAHAHARGVVHRDVKPQNVLIADDRDGGTRAMLTDFGIARVSGSPTLTATGEVVGTLAYMAPEQSEGLSAGPPADVYSLALTLYECWAGANPVVGPTPAATARAIGAPLPSLGERRPHLPPDLVALIDACLAPDPADRPAPAVLARGLAQARGALDADRPIPVPGAATPSLSAAIGWRRIGAFVALAGALTLVGGPVGASGAALVIAALALPALLLLPGWAAATPFAAPLFAIAGAAIAYPAAAAHAGIRVAQHAAAGALGWCWTVAAAAGFGVGPATAVAPAAPDGWESSTGRAGEAVLAPLLEPASLAALVTFAAAAAILGRILAARHLALAALAALGWSAGMAALAGVLVDGSIAASPVLIAVAAAAAVGFEHLRRSRVPAPELPPRRREGVPAVSAEPPAAAAPRFGSVPSH